MRDASSASPEFEGCNPIEGGVEQVYQEIRSSLELILGEWNEEGYSTSGLLNMLDDAIGNNWPALMDTFWEGVKQDVEANTQ